MSHPTVLAVARPSARRLGAALDSQSAFTNLQTGNFWDRRQGRRYIGTCQNAPDHAQRVPGPWHPARDPPPYGECCPPIPHSRGHPLDPLCVLPQAPRNKRRLVARVHVPLICILRLFPLSRGMAFPTPPPPPPPPSPAICASPVSRGSSNPACPPKGRKGEEGGRVCLRQREKYLERVDARRTAHSHLGRGDGV